MAPELLNVHENEPLALPSKTSDIYSFGGIMLHVCFVIVSAFPLSLLMPSTGPHWPGAVSLSQKRSTSHHFHY